MKKFTLLIFVSLLSICGYGQLALESFEDPWVTGTPAAPTGWTVVNEQGPAVTWARTTAGNTSTPPNTGTYAAYLNKQNVSPSDPVPKDWLITPYFNMPANAQLRFFSRLTQPGDQGGVYKVKISTDANPANLASYSDLQTWTEVSINPVQTDYFEKIITLPSLTGSVHIAFVMEGDDKDRWLIDDVKVVSQCLAPATLTATGITMTDVTLNWINTGSATSWEVEILLDSETLTGNGETFTGPPTFTKTTLLPDTAYKAYVTAVCADGGTSEPIGPVFFTTAALGESCNYPIVVTPPPYTNSNNTVNFANNYLGSPGTTCGTTGTYLAGNDVVYSYTPTANGNININLSGNVGGTGMFVYDNCADIGTACISGGIATTAVPINIASLAVTANNTIYIVISTNTGGATTPYTLNIQQVFCAAPTGLASTNPTATSADITWATGTATAWELAVQPAGTGLPTVSGIAVTTNTITATQTITGAFLSPATSYEFYVRANCGDGTYSIWTGPFAFTTTQIPAIINYTQDWESAPHNWTLSNGNQANKWVVGTATSNASTQSLYISNDNGANNLYTITSASVVHAYRDVTIPVGAGSLNLAFDWKNIGETNVDYIRAYLVPVTFIPTPGAQIVASATNIKIGGDLSGSSTWSAFNGVVNVAALAGTNRRLILEWRNTASGGSQPPAAIDNINLSVITCPAPSNPTVVAGTLTSSQVNISWTAPTPVPPGYEYYLSTTPTPPVASTPISGTSATTTATNVPLTPSTSYYFWVRANCGTTDKSTWTGPLNFIAPQIAASMDYTQNFDLGPHGWALNNGTQINKWVVGSAVSNSASSSLYISEDNGTSNTYNINSGSVVHAYRDIQMPTTLDQLQLSFDWKNMGENATDYFRVWIVPVTFNPTPGTQITTTNGVQVGGNFMSVATWTMQTSVIQASTFAGTARRLVFEWRNSVGGGTQPPAAIDNINLSVVPCPQPSNLAMSALSSTAVTFTWTAPTSGTPASGYEYYLGTNATPPTAATAASGPAPAATITINSLPPSTTYYMWVRSNCTSSTSNWIGPVSFITPQIPATFDYSENFDGAPHKFDFISGTQENKWVVGSAVSNSSPNSLYISNDGGVTNGYNINSASVVHAYRDITFPAIIDQAVLSFDWKNVGEAGVDYIRVWLVPVDFIPTPGTQIVAGTGRAMVIGNLSDNPLWTTSNNTINAVPYQGQTKRLVFEWRNTATTGTQPPAAIDNISFSVVTCPPPTNLSMPLNDLLGTTFTWTPPASVSPTFDFYYTTSPTAPGETTVPSGNVPTPTVTLSGLPDSSNYYFWVRDNCGPGDTSLWLGPFEFSTPQVADALPYSQNFDGNTYDWTITNGTQTNKWFVGTAVSNSASKSLYVSNTSGTTNNYNTTAGTVVHSYKDFIIPAGATALDFSFDWKNVGQSGVDYIRVWRVPATFVPTTGTAITTAADRELIGTFSNSSLWTTQSFVLNSTTYANSTIRFVFEWRNDTFTGTQPPGAVDNIELSVVTCPKPTALGVTAPTQTGATFNWTEAGTAPAWEVYVVPAGQPAPTATSVGVDAPTSTFVYTTPALLPSTNYVYYVRAVCGPNDKSKWSGPVAFITAIANDECTGAYTLTVNPLAQPCASFGTVSYLGSTPSPQAFDCGGINGSDVWYQFVATEDRINIELSDFAIVTPISPIVIALYQGDQCGSLLQVDCSVTNVLSAKNLIVGATYKVRVYINELTPNLNTSFKLCINTPPPPSSLNPSACTVTTVNYSFENPTPVAPTTFPQMIHHNTVQGWRTTAADQIMEFWPTPNYEFVPPYDGTQFVELNANLVSGLYQDYPTPQSTTFTYSFGHRGRFQTDSCKLLAGPPGGPYVEVMTATTPNTAWVEYTGTYTTPASQTITRFIFQSASTWNGDGSVGNFLDAIEFTADNGVLSVTPTELTCIDNTATVVAAGSGEWSAHADNPAETIIADAESNNTTISGFSANGVYRFDWTTQYCSSTIEVTYDNGSVPEPIVVSPIEYCVGETAVLLIATPLADHTLNWYATATGGTASTTAPTPDTTINNVTVYYVAQQSALNCESPRVPIEVTVHAIPAAPVATAAVEYCEDTAATPLTATALAGHTLNWYTQPTGGTASATAPTPDTSTAAVTSYYVSQTSAATCESDRTEIVVTINASIIPVTDFTLVDSVCIQDADPIAVPATGFTTGGVYSADAGLVINPTTGEVNLGASTPGTYTVTYTVSPDPAVCNLGNSSSVEITIVPEAAAVTGFSYTTPVCSGSLNLMPTLAPGFTTGGIFTADGGLLINPETGTIDSPDSPAGDYTITYTVDQSIANCVAGGTSTATLTIIQVVTPVTGFDYDDSFCFGATDASPNLAADFTAGGTFTGTPGLVIDATTGLVSITGSTSGSHTVTYTYTADPANCIQGGSSSSTFTIGNELDFGFNGQCEGTVYVVTASPSTGSFDDNDPTVSFRWSTTSGTTVGTDSYIFNVSDYANSTPENDTFPMEFILTVTVDGCETARSYTVEDITCTIQKGISPNNDGLNDYFDLEFMGVKKLSIFNRYGQEVYTKGNYKNEWYGQGSNGDELPTGTYYFVIERSAGGTNTGWIYINRQE